MNMLLSSQLLLVHYCSKQVNLSIHSQLLIETTKTSYNRIGVRSFIFTQKKRKCKKRWKMIIQQKSLSQHNYQKKIICDT